MFAIKRRFCFLQGPHGPFFRELAAALARQGHQACRIGFNQGDEREWGRVAPYRAFRGSLDDWREAAGDIFEQERATDLVVYGDARPYHAIAIDAATERGLRIHFFEEGYLRPYWITYEREGVNGRSSLMRIDVSDIPDEQQLSVEKDEIPPAKWGELNAHVVHSLKYHIGNHFLNSGYPNFHRHLPNRPIDDWRNVAARVLKIPFLRMKRVARERKVLEDPRNYHLVLLQLGWDASMRRYSPFRSVSEVIETCLRAFAKGASQNEFIVFKTHPLEDGREGLESRALEIAEREGVAPDRLAFIEGGKLAPLIARSKSVVTVNSTAAQQALWRNKPVRALGQAIFAKPGLVSMRPLTAFFAEPDAPDPALYRRFRHFLLATSQIRGGFYTSQGRALALAPALKSMLSAEDPYETALGGPIDTLVAEDDKAVAEYAVIDGAMAAAPKVFRPKPRLIAISAAEEETITKRPGLPKTVASG